MKETKVKKAKPKYAGKTWVFRRAGNKVSEHVRICPNCGSLDINQETPGDKKNIIFGLPTQYKCRNCGFENYVFPEVNVNDLNKKSKNKAQKENKAHQ